MAPRSARTGETQADPQIVHTGRTDDRHRRSRGDRHRCRPRDRCRHRVRLAADGLAVAVLDLDEAPARRPWTRSRRPAAARSRSGPTSPTPPRSTGRRPGRRGARAADGAGQQRRRHPRQPAVQDDRGRLGHRDGRAPAGLVPDEPRRAEAHGRREVGPHRQPVQHLRAGQPRPGQLLHGEGRPAGLHQDAGDRARQVRHHRELRRARVHRQRHDEGDRRADRRDWEHLRRGPGRAIPVGAPARSGGHRQRRVVLRRTSGAGFVSGQVIYVAGGPKA